MFTASVWCSSSRRRGKADCAGKIGQVPGEAPVSTLDSRIHAAFATRLEESALVDGVTARALGDLLSSEKLPKPEELLKVYATSGEGAGA